MLFTVWWTPFLLKGFYFPAEFEFAAGFGKGPEWMGNFSAAHYLLPCPASETPQKI